MTSVTRRVVVVGNGMAGFRFVQELSSLDTRCAITVIGDEPGGAYNRVQLSQVLAGAAAPDSIELADHGWYAARGVTLHSATSVLDIDRRVRRVMLEGRRARYRELGYDVLVLATGSRAVLPQLPGLTRPDGRLTHGAVAFRTLADCAEIGTLAARARSAVVVGGGVLGLETARALAGLGLPVTVLQRGSRLMDRHLDSEASRVLARTLRSFGVTVRTRASLRGVAGGGRVTGVVLGDGSRLDADLFVLCCGAAPRTELARSAGLAAGVGVIVDDQLRSIVDPAIFAIGECAEHRGRTHGLVAPSWEQAQVAARVIADPHAAVSYPGSRLVIRLKAAGIELVTLGSAVTRGAEIVRFTDTARGAYCKLVVRDSRLAGAILLGRTEAAGTITQLFDRGTDLPADRSSLLVSSRDAGTAVTDRATICQCNGVTRAAIRGAWKDGARDTAAVAARTRATTGCGTCRDAVEGILGSLAAAS